MSLVYPNRRFPPKPHAETHGLGGVDPVSLDASQIVSGTLSLDRIPNTLSGKDADLWDGYHRTDSQTIGGNVTIGGDLQINGNDIKDSSGTVRITLGSTVTINGNLQVNGRVSSVVNPLALDDTQVSTTSTSPTELKYARFVKDSNKNMDWRTLYVFVEGRVSTSGQTLTVQIFINNEASPRATISITSTSYALYSATIDISDLGNGVHRVGIKAYVSGGTGYIRFTGVYASE